MKRLIVFMLIMGSVAELYAQQTAEAKSFSLQEAIGFAKQHNYSLQNSKLDEVAAQKKVKEVLAAGLPQVNANANLTNNITVPSAVINFGGQSQTIQFGNPYASSGSITASQLIFDGSWFLGLKAATEFVNLAKINTKRSETELEVNVYKAYTTVLLLEANKKMMEAALLTLEKSKKDVEVAYKNGLAEKTDADKLTLTFSSKSIDKAKIEDQIQLSYLLLKLQMGLSLSDSINLKDNLESLFSNHSLISSDATIDYSRRPEYQSLNQLIRLQDYDKKRYTFGYFPTLSAALTHQRNSFAVNFSDLTKEYYPGTILSFNLNVPIFDGFRKSAQIQQVKVNKSKYENDLKNLESGIQSEVTQSKLKFNRAVQILDIQKKNMELADDIYKKINIKYQNGLSSTLELITAENDLKSAQTAYLTSMYDYLNAQIELKKALGL